MFNIIGNVKEYTAMLYKALNFTFILVILDTKYPNIESKRTSINALDKYITNIYINIIKKNAAKKAPNLFIDNASNI